MKDFFLKWLVNIICIFAVVNILPGIKVEDWQTLAVAGLVLGFINAFLRPLVILLTLPINILSLGLFTFIINGFLFYLVSKIVKGFLITDFWSAFWGSMVFSAVSFFISMFIKPTKARSFHRTTHKSAQGHSDRRSSPDIIDIEAKEVDK